MRIQPDGDIEIATEEKILVAVTAVRTHYLAIFSDLLTADWAIVEPLHATGNNGAREVRSFKAHAAGTEAFTITCDFVRNAAGDTNQGAEYEIALKGEDGPFTIVKRIRPVPPFPIARPFVFEVVQK
jgi:hypothetical protein